MGGRAGGGASGGMGSRSRGGGSLKTSGRTLGERLNSVFGNADTEGIGSVQLNGEISDFVVEKNTSTVKEFKYKFKGSDSPTAHPSLKAPATNGWHSLQYVKDSEGWYINDFG